MSDGEHGIFENLRGKVCACGDEKKDGKSFCRLCYFRLPKILRDALYRSERYVETYRSALEYLGLTEPRDPAVVARETYGAALNRSRNQRLANWRFRRLF